MIVAGMALDGLVSFPSTTMITFLDPGHAYIGWEAMSC
jgi:hypothetical protein